MHGEATCRWCGKTLEQHLDSRAPDDPVPRMPCLGLKAYFCEGRTVMDNGTGVTERTEERAETEVVERKAKDVELLGGQPIELNIVSDADGAEFKLDARCAVRARRALSRWIEAVEHEAEDAWEDGRSGYIGRLKFCAFFTEDEGLTLRVESSTTEDL